MDTMDQDMIENLPINLPSNASFNNIVLQLLATVNKNLKEKNTFELLSLYDTFPSISEQFFAKSSWPDPTSIANQISNSTPFIILYKQIYYKHIYTNLQPSVEDRFASFENYCDLFNLILNNNIDWDLPAKWLWDIIDEFIYQFQSFCQFRDRQKSKSLADSKAIHARPDVWNVHSVLNVLYSLVQKSQINQQLVALRTNKDVAAAAGEFGSKQLYRHLGYFSLVGLLRVHCLLGDYSLALSTISNLETGQKSLVVRVANCQISSSYYTGFAYMMCRRYLDAIKTFSSITSFISRTRQYHHRSLHHDQLARRADQIIALLTICLVLSPNRIDDSILSTIKEKYGDQFHKLQRGGHDSLSTFQDLFLFSCPKFISPVPLDMESASSDPTHHQLRIFMREVTPQIMLPTLRSHLKLYTNVTLTKLSSVLGISVNDTLKLILMMKHKSRQRQCSAAGVSDGDEAVMGHVTDINVYVKNDHVVVGENRNGKRCLDWFIRNISKLDDVVGNV